MVFDDGTKLDVIEVGEVDLAQLPDDESNRLFIEAHRWAYDSATTETITALDPNTEVIHSTVSIRLADPAALIPMKVRAAEARPRNNEKKKASDGLDADILLDRLDADGACEQGHRGAVGHPRADRGDIRRGFVVNADATAGRINRWMSLPEPIAPDDLRRVATRFLRRMT